jgi:hypothetical protein
MLPRRLCSLAPAMVLALGFVSTNALADQPARHRDHMAGRNADGRHAARHHHHLARRDFGSGAGPYRGPVYSQPGFVFVPGKGILGEDCNMPTSTCANELRDTQ